jgi:hypothetical protein
MQLPNCDLCGKSVELKSGVLSISFQKVREVQDQKAKWEKAHPGPVLHVSEVMTFPSRVHWVWQHCGCNVDGSSYEIEASRFDNVSKALHWTLHLMAKNWFEFTDWRSVIARFYPECS